TFATGPALVTTESSPDQVRVPNLERETTQVAISQLKVLGLELENASGLFQTDQIVNTSPDAGQWVREGTSVSVDVLRQTPNVVSSTLSNAQAGFNNYRLQATVNGKSFPDDIVVNQDPAGGTYVPLNRVTNLSVQLAVPTVTQLSLQDASNTLSNKDLVWS